MAEDLAFMNSGKLVEATTSRVANLPKVSQPQASKSRHKRRRRNKGKWRWEGLQGEKDPKGIGNKFPKGLPRLDGPFPEVRRER